MKKIWIVPVAAALAAGGWYYWQQHHQSGLPEGFAQSNGRLCLFSDSAGRTFDR